MPAASPPEGATPGSFLAVIALGVVTVAALFAGFWVKTVDADVLWHLRTGRLIWEMGAIPRTDPYSSSAAGAEWIGQEWLWQVVAWRLFSLGSWTALSVARVAAVAAAVVLAVSAARIQKAGWLSCLAASVLALSLVMAIPELRPHTASYPLFAAVLLVLEASHRRPLFTYALPLLFALWANLHGAYLNGLVLVSAYAASDIWLLRRAGGSATERASLRHLLFAGACSVAAALATPFGLGTLTYAFRVVTVPFFRSRVYEWSPPDLSVPFYPFILALALVGAILVSARRGVGTRHWAVALVFAAMALRARRQIPFFGLAVLPAVAVGIERLLQSAKPTARRAALRMSPLLAAMVLVFALVCYRGVRAGFGTGLEERRFPERPAALLAMLPPGGAVLNDYNEGGYLIWRLWPDLKVVMDGRVDVYGPQVVGAYDRVWRGEPGWRDWVGKWSVRAILGRYEITDASPKHNLYHELAASTDWALVYWDERNILYVRRDETSGSAVLRPYEVVSPGLRWPEMRKVLRKKSDWEALRRDLDRSVAENPGDRRAAALRRYLEALENQLLTGRQPTVDDAQK